MKRWNPIPKRSRNVGAGLAAKMLARGKRGEFMDRTIDAKGKTPRKTGIPDALAKFLIPIGERLKP